MKQYKLKWAYFEPPDPPRRLAPSALARAPPYYGPEYKWFENDFKTIIIIIHNNLWNNINWNEHILNHYTPHF